MKKLKLVLTTTILASLVGCVNGDDYGTPDLSNDCISIAATKSVQDIATLANTTVQQYPDSDYIEAYVTSSDEGGNFYKSISFVSVDGNKGFTMPVDSYNLYTEFEPGRKVTINMQNRYFHYKNQISSLEIGSLYEGSVGRISGVEYKDAILRSCDKVDEETLVQHISLSQINDSYLHKIVEFDGVQFADASLGHTYHDEALSFVNATATNHSVIDAAGNSITVRNSAFATFASEEIPSESGKIRGVLTKYNGTFQLMLRTLNDVKLTNARLHPAIENFESFTTTNTNVFPNYLNITVQGTNDWYVGLYNGNRYLQARKGSNSGATKIFFVMPFDFDTHTKVSFKTLYGYMSQTSTPIMKVYYSTNFNSSNPTANLVDITSSFTFSTHTGTGWAPAFTDSGVHTFTGMSGQGHIIFAYDVATTSTANAETRPGAQIDNILFQ
ncbi:DUF5689 domain-containing protein [Flavobacterium sp. HXWNR69]|uniref:DUF5689 domain-containing protein n=1 Tax=Flavobacterium fragile TaxID=2949085 RepID=A0ABT0TEM5_9FLAO|nr:DUF5689 domain-containing protein [Flavobacterium sp. HXWNR69]MCL9769408.1 DUF5689 domain-containing protein [Flavobacterium sp. HXWNR69]